MRNLAILAMLLAVGGCKMEQADSRSDVPDIVPAAGDSLEAMPDTVPAGWAPGRD